MPKKYDNTIYKIFFRSKTIKVILSSITRIRLIVYNNNNNSLLNVRFGSLLGLRGLLLIYI